MDNVVMLLSNPFRPDTRVLKEANSLVNYGFKVSIICWDRAREYVHKELLPNGVIIYRVQQIQSRYGIGAAQLGKLPFFWHYALRILEQLKPTILHCHDFDTLPLGIAYGSFRNIPVIYDSHEYYPELIQPRLNGLGNLIPGIIRKIEPILVKKTAGVITVNNQLASYYQKFTKQVVIIGHYPDPELYKIQAKPFSGSKIDLVYIGRLARDRGLYAYLEILRGLKNTGIKATLKLAGTFTPSLEHDIFISTAGGDIENIRLIGWVPYNEVPSLLSQEDVGLCILHPIPRYINALPVKMFEYMAAGLPIIISDFPLIRDIVSPIGCGVLVDPTDFQGMISTVIDWLGNPELAVKTGQRGRLAILDTYNWSKLEDQLLELYECLI